MAAQWADFPNGDQGLYGTTETYMLDGTPWAAIAGSLIDDPDPNVTDGLCYNPSSGLNNNPFVSGDRLALPTPVAAPGASLRFWVTSLPGSTASRNAVIAFSNVDNTAGYVLVQEMNGALAVYRRSGTAYTELATTTSPVSTANSWLHVSFTVDFITGEYSVEREGFPIAALAGTDSAPVGTNGYFFQSLPRTGTEVNSTLRIKDLFIWDQTGTVNLDHPGPVTVYRRTVTADVSSGWTSTGASAYEVLDETPPSDADYISADDTLPAAAIMNLDDLPDDVVSVRAVMMIGRMRKTDGGDCTVQMGITPNGGTDYAVGSDRPITTAYTYWHDWSELSPDTGAAWTPIEFNAADIRVNRTL